MSDSSHASMMGELELLVRELIEHNIDRVALAKTLAIVDKFLLPPQPMTPQRFEAMLEKLFRYWIEIDDLTDYRNELEALQTMTPAELSAVRWYDQCFDCGERAWSKLHEDFMVLDDLWYRACMAEPPMEDGGGLLCIACIERRLGRQLCRDDFKSGLLCNEDSQKKSARLMDRMMRR